MGTFWSIDSAHLLNKPCILNVSYADIDIDFSKKSTHNFQFQGITWIIFSQKHIKNCLIIKGNLAKFHFELQIPPPALNYL